jgi:hypothetical protein
MSVLFLSCFFLSCDSEDFNTNSIHYSKSDYTLYQLGRFSGLDEDAEWQIVQAYFAKLQNDGKNTDLTINDVWVDQYYGSYCPVYLFPEYVDDLLNFLRTDYLDSKNHTVVAFKANVKDMDYGTKQRDVMINTPGSGWPSVIRYYDKSSILLWDKGHLYDIEEDTDYLRRSLLAAWDSRKIINRHNGLDVETDAMIREDILKFILTGTDWSADDYAAINMTFLGTYNGYTALTLFSGGGSQHVSYRQIIDGVLFSFPSSPIRIFAWKEGEIYELGYLYEQGLVTREDLVEMAYFHHAGKEPIE